MDEMNKILKIISMSVVALIILIILITGANILFFWSILNWFQNIVSATTGLDGPLAKGVAAIFLGLIVIVPMGKMLLSFSPIPIKNKNYYRAIIFGFIALFSFFTYFGGKNIYFNPQTGKAEKYYSVSSSGEYKFFSEPGYDPLTGDKLQVVTKEVVLKSKNLFPEKKVNDYQPPIRQERTPKSLPPTSNSEPEESVPELKTDENLSNNSNSGVNSQQTDPTSSRVRPADNYNYQPRNYLQPKRAELKAENNNTTYYSGNRNNVQLKNSSLEDVIILNSFKEVVTKISAQKIMSLEMNPGKYFLMWPRTNKLTPFFVPENKNYVLQIAAPRMRNNAYAPSYRDRRRLPNHYSRY